MCGIFGVLNFNEVNVNKKSFQDSVNIIKHRGPDDEGYAFFNTFKKTSEERFGDTSAVKKGTHILSDSKEVLNLAFGFRRLSIIDWNHPSPCPKPNRVFSITLQVSVCLSTT